MTVYEVFLHTFTHIIGCTSRCQDCITPYGTYTGTLHSGDFRPCSSGYLNCLSPSWRLLVAKDEH